MSSRINQIIRLWITDDDNEKFYNRDMPDMDRMIDSDSFKVENVKLAAGTEDYEVNFGQMTEITFMYLSSTKPISFKLNDADNEEIAVNILNPTILNSAGITALFLTNSGSEDANVELIICKQVIS